MIKIFKDLLGKDVAKGHRVKVLWRFFWLHFIFLFRKTYVFEWIHGLKIKAIHHWPGTTECYYYGKYDIMELSFLEKYLKEDDVFLDVGSNIGSYSLLSTKVSGCNCFTIEPEPKTYEEMVNNVKRNGLEEKIHPLNIAVSDENGSIYFTTNLDMCNHIVEKGEDLSNTIQIECKTLDEIFKNDSFNNMVIKIDVEKYEPQVLKGAIDILSSGKVDIVIIEVLYNREEIDDILSKHGYTKYLYDWKQNKMINGDVKEDNYIYVRDIDVVEKRIKTKINIMGDNTH